MKIAQLKNEGISCGHRVTSGCKEMNATVDPSSLAFPTANIYIRVPFSF